MAGGAVVIAAVIFSRNRPMQLDALLTSIARWAPDLYRETRVLWRADTVGFGAGYYRVWEDWPLVSPTRETAFPRDVRAALDHGQPHTAFHCDDDFFYREPEGFLLPSLSDELCFSLRLGENTTYCQTLDAEQTTPGARAWQWPKAEHDFGYPFSLNGHVYRTEKVRALVHELGEPPSFDSPNDLEHRGQALMREAPREWGEWMLSSRHSSVVSNPVNRVNDGYPNPCDGRAEWTAEALNERYLAGQRLDLDAMDFSNVAAAHQVIPLAFT